MEVEISTEHHAKVLRVLQKFLDPNFKIKNDVYLNLFLTHLVGKKGDEQTASLIYASNDVLQWIIQASDLWEKKIVTPPQAILSFTLNMASRFSKDEQVFVRLNSQNVYESLAGLVQAKQNPEATVTLSFISLLCSFLEHKSGTQWVLATSYWLEMVNLGMIAQTMYIRKKAYQFVIKLLEKTINFNRKFCVNLVDILTKHLKQTIRSLPSANCESTEVQNRALFESLKPSLNFITEVTETLLKSFNRNVLTLFLELEIPETIENIMLISHTEEFSYELMRVWIVFMFFKICEKFEGIKFVAHDSMVLFDIVTFFNYLKSEIDKDHVRLILKISYHSHALWYHVAARLPLCVRKGETIEFQHQMILLQLMPVFVLSIKLLGHQEGNRILMNDDFRRDYVQKIVKMSAIKTVELFYKWRERLLEKSGLIDDVVFSLQYLVKTKRLINKEKSVLLFQPLVYSLRDCLTYMEVTASSQMSVSLTNYLNTLIETLIDLIKTYDFTWKDSIETISVMDLAYEFLQQAPNKLTMKGLQLFNIAISKYMSPNMILLMDTTRDCTISQTGSLLYAKCHDASWEIRDSALEIVCTLAFNANTKFPAFKNTLLEAELPQLVVEMALKDGEYYVRATALKCLQEAIQVNEIWEALINVDRFLENILNIFQTETEGIVRKEAATLVCKIYDVQNFPEAMLSKLYDVMTHAAIGDLHWEVKMNALDFWCKVIERHLTNQGMLDGLFPNVTFSKEHRKIVTLNETEVKKRLIKVLHQLSHIGCLYVYVNAIQDDCDIEVAKKATNTTKKFVELLKRYKVPSENINLSQPPSPLYSFQPSGNVSSPVSSASSNQTASSATSGNSPQSEASSPTVHAIPFFELVSPYPIPISPSLFLDMSSPTNSSHRPEDIAYPDSEHVSVRNACNGNTTTNDLQPFDSIQIDFDPAQVEECDPNCDALKTEELLEEILNSNDMNLLQGIYNPGETTSNSTIQMKTKSYLSPTEYLRFAYDRVESHANRRSQWLNSLDEFGSLLDDILKEYDGQSDINGMDCY